MAEGEGFEPSVPALIQYDGLVSKQIVCATFLPAAGSRLARTGRVAGLEPGSTDIVLETDGMRRLDEDWVGEAPSAMLCQLPKALRVAVRRGRLF